MSWSSRLIAVASAAATLAGGLTAALAQDKLTIAAGQRGNFDTSISEIGNRLGIFKKHGLEVEILWTQGSGETQQAVISRSVDLGFATGTLGMLSAFMKGAPVRIVGAQMTGAQDLYWYVKADSPIKSMKDIGGKTIAYSTNGSSTHSIVTAFISEFKVAAKPVATGNPPSTLTQVMSGQVDVGWAAPPFGLDQLDKNEIRRLASGNDTSFKSMTVRTITAHAETLKAKKEVLARFFKAYREAIDAAYADPKAMQVYADWLQISVEKATRARNDFFPKEGINPDRIVGLEAAIPEAIALKFIPSAPTKEQLAELIQIFPRQ